MAGRCLDHQIQCVSVLQPWIQDGGSLFTFYITVGELDDVDDVQDGRKTRRGFVVCERSPTSASSEMPGMDESSDVVGSSGEAAEMQRCRQDAGLVRSGSRSQLQLQRRDRHRDRAIRSDAALNPA